MDWRLPRRGRQSRWHRSWNRSSRASSPHRRRRDLNLRLEDRDLRLAGLGRLIPGLPGSAGCVGSPGFVGALCALANVAASTVSPSFAYETAAVSVLSAVAVTVMVAAYSVLSYVTPSALPATCTSVYSYVPAASNGSWSKVTVPSAAFVVVPGTHHVPQPQGERLRFARHRRRDRIRPCRRQQRCRYTRPPVHEQVQEPGRAVHVRRRHHRPRPDHQGCG